jgi:hypothetical protein
VNDPAFGRLLAFETQVIKVSGVPQRTEGALKDLLVVNVACTNEHASLDGFPGDAAIAMGDDVGNEFLLSQSNSAQKKEGQQQTYEPEHKGTLTR